MREQNAQFNESMRARTMAMSVAVRNLFNSVKIRMIDRPGIHQLIRSSSSVAANYRSSTRSRSAAEFYSKICLVVEECDETLFWVDYLVKTGVLTISEIGLVSAELDELIRIFSSIKRSMKIKLGV